MDFRPKTKADLLKEAVNNNHKHEIIILADEIGNENQQLWKELRQCWEKLH